jgi:hypothetical protein
MMRELRKCWKELGRCEELPESIFNEKCYHMLVKLSVKAL